MSRVCRSFTAPLECISTLTAGCQPVQRLTLYALLHLYAVAPPACSPETLSSIPAPPPELQPFLTCLQEFTASFRTALYDSTDLSASTDGFVTCLLTMDVQILVTQPPAYKVYFSQAVAFVRNGLLPAVTCELRPCLHFGVFLSFAVQYLNLD